MRCISGVALGAFLTFCCGCVGSAGAQTADIKTIVSVGGPPIVLNQNSQLNMAGVFMIGGSTSATVTQNGSNNATGILQFGGATASSVGQTGVTNFAFVGQAGQSAGSLLSQLGTMNSGVIAQFGTINLSTVVQHSP